MNPFPFPFLDPSLPPLPSSIIPSFAVLAVPAPLLLLLLAVDLNCLDPSYCMFVAACRAVEGEFDRIEEAVEGSAGWRMKDEGCCCWYCCCCCGYGELEGDGWDDDDDLTGVADAGYEGERGWLAFDAEEDLEGEGRWLLWRLGFRSFVKLRRRERREIRSVRIIRPDNVTSVDPSIGTDVDVDESRGSVKGRGGRIARI